MGLVAALVFVLASSASAAGQATAQTLTQLQFDIVGLRLAVDPPTLTVPKDIPTFVNAQLTLPAGASQEAHAVIDGLARGAAVLAELRGPELSPTTISALPGQPLNLPPFRVTGDYFLDNIRLVKNGAVILSGAPPVVPITVVDDILVSRVTTRELSIEEIRQRGIVIDESSFRALEFQAAFVIDGKPVKINFPVILPMRPGLQVPGRPIMDLAFGVREAQEQQQRVIIELPPELDRPGLNLYLVGAEFKAVEPDATEPTLQIPPINALIAIVGNIGFLNQIFAATVMVQNGAPDGTSLVVRNVRAAFSLPKGLDQVAGTPGGPGDDPLRFARTAQGVRSVVPVLHPGLDGAAGTGDDRDFLRPQESGDGEGLLEGLREGTHVFDIELTAVLEGLPSGPVQLRGAAKGTVLVRNPTFSLTLSQPRTVRVDEPFELYATVTNTSDRTVNLVSVTLDRRAVSGAELLSEGTVQFDTIAAGESATARFRLKSQRTGEVSFTQITTDPGITANFTLRAGVDERGVPLSPNALVLPKQVDRLPEALVAASQRVLGQAFSIATAPQLPPNVRYVPRRIVNQRGRELAEVGMRLTFGEPITAGLSDLLLDWLGNTTSDPGFEQLLRTTEAGSAWAEALGGVFQGQLGAGTLLDFQRALADALVYRAPHLSAIVGSDANPAPVRLRITDALGQQTGLGPTGAQPARNIPSSQLVTLVMQGESRSQMAVVGKLNSAVYTVEVFGTGTGVTDLGIVVPSGAAKLTHLTWENLAVARGSRLVVTVDTRDPASPQLRIDRDGDGVFEDARLPTSSAEIGDRAPEVVAARSLTDVTESFVYNSKLAHLGLLVDVLFNKTVTAESAQALASYAIPNNAVLEAILQPTGRVVTLLLERPIGALIRRDLTVSGIADARGQVSRAETVSIRDLLADGAKLIGQVRRADGRPVPNAFVRLGVSVVISPFPCECTAALIRADANGYFDVDFVRKAFSPYFRVTATDPLTGEEVNVQSRVRFEGETAVANPVFFGRGRVVGRILLPDGVTPAGTAAVNLFPDFLRTGETGSGVYASAQGTFAIEQVPVGSFAIRAERVEFRPDPRGGLTPFSTGEFATVTSAVKESGETVELTIVLTRWPDVGIGGVRGRVFLGDGRTPAVRNPVFVGNIETRTDPVVIRALAQSETDAGGNFEFLDLPAGTTSVIAVDPGTKQFTSAQVEIRPDELVGANLIFGSLGAVTGIVRDASGNLVRNALVAGGFGLVTTDENGRFLIPEIPTGRQTIAAGSQATKRTGTAPVDVFPGQTSEVEVRLRAVADITGRVTDAQGVVVKGADVRVPVPDAGYFKAETDENGIYVFPNMALGDYTVSAQGAGTPALSPDEVATKLRDDFGEAARSGSLATIRAAFKQAVEVFVGTSSLLFQEPPAATPGNFGFTTVRSFQDGVAAIADIQYIPTGRIAGVTVDGKNLPTKASMQIQGLTLSDFGSPVFGSLGFFESDVVTGRFVFPAATFGEHLLSAARPFSPSIITRRGVLNPSTPDDENIVIQFPSAAETSGTISGTVFLPDGVTPAGEGVEVRISFGDLTVRTDRDGRFRSPVPANRYLVTAEDLVSTLSGQIAVLVNVGQVIDVQLRLLGRTSVTITVKRPDGVPVAGAAVEVKSNGFPGDEASGTTGLDGKVTLSNLSEGSHGVLAVSGDQLKGRASFAITQADVTMERVVEATVTMRGTGTITGTFFRTDGVTPIRDGQIMLFVSGIATAGALNPAVTIQSDARGRFAFDAVPVGDFTVRGLDPTSLRVGEARGRLVNQNDAADVAVVTGALGRVTGQVLSADGLRAVGGATVSIFPTLLPGGSISFHGFPAITAGADGTFVYDAVPEGPSRLTAFDPDSRFSGEAEGALTGEGSTATVTIRVDGFGTLRGQVFETDGRPATNVDVRIASLKVLSFGRRTAVDADGRFEFRFLPLHRFTLEARKLDPLERLNGGIASTELTAPGQEADVRIDMRGVGSVDVTVIDAGGRPVPSADVKLHGRTVFGGSFAVFTPSNGVVTIPGVPVGLFDVSSQSSTLRVAGTASGTIPGHGQTERVLVRLGPAGSIRGRLVLPDASATPVPGAFVTLDFASETSFAGTLQVQTNATGEFAFDNIPVGPFTIGVLEPITAGLATLGGSIDQNEQVVDLGDIALDLETPRVVSTSPVEGAVGVSVTRAISVTFNEPIDPASVKFDNFSDPRTVGGNVQLVDSQQSRKVAADIEVAPDGRTLVVTPRQPLASETRYQLVVRNGTTAIRDAAAGRTVQTTFVLSFTSIDSVPPRLDSQSPGPGATAVATDAVVRLTFDEAMAAGFALSLTRSGVPVPGAVSLLLGGTVAVFTPAAPLATSATHRYALGGATDLAGNPLAGTVSVEFTTIDTRGPPISELALAGRPSRIAGTSVTVLPTIADTDTARVEYAINDVPVTSSGTAPFGFTLTLPVGENQLRVSATAVDASANRGSTTSLVIPIVQNRAPTVTLVNRSGATTVRQGDVLTFDVTASDDVGLARVLFSAVGAVRASVTQPVPGQASFSTSFTLTIPANAPSTGQVIVQAVAVDGVDGPSAPATLTFEIRDGTRPAVAFVSPVNEAQVIPGVPVTVVVSASDDVALTTVRLTCLPALTGCGPRGVAGTISTQTFTLEVPATLVAPASITLTASAADGSLNASLDAIRTLRVADTVAPAITSLATVSGSAQVAAGQSVTVRASATDNVAVTFVAFRVEGGVTQTTTVPLTPAASPATADLAFTVPPGTPDGTSITVRAEARDGVRDGTGNASPEATLALTVRTADAAPPIVTITSPAADVEVTPGHSVTLSVSATDDGGVRRIAFTGGVLGNGERIFQPPVTPALAVFTIAVPAGTVPATVTLSVTAEDAAGNVSAGVSRRVTVLDAIAPAVRIAAPAPGVAVDPRVPLGVTVEATDTVGVTEITLTAAGTASGTQTRAITPAAASTTQTFTVAFGAPPATGGSVTLDATARDARGNQASAASVTVSVRDVVAPTVAQVTPPDGATGVDPAAVITLRFTEPVSRATVTAATVQVRAGATTIPAALGFTSGDVAVTVTPASPLPLNTLISVSAGTAVTDRAGNALTAAFSATFRTASPDVTPPRVASITPANGATEVSVATSIQVTFSEPIEPATITGTSFRVIAAGAAVGGRFSFFNADATVRFTPDQPLPFATSVTTTLTPAITDRFNNALADEGGNPLAQPLTFTFSTGSFAITNPTSGAEVVEHTQLLLEARASASLGAATVIFTVNGQALPPVSGPSFAMPFTAPAAATTPTLTVHATARAVSGAIVAEDEVVASVVVGLAFSPRLVGVPVGGTVTVKLLLSSPAPSDVPIDVSAIDATFVTLPAGSVILPAGRTDVPLVITGASTGNTTVLASSERGTAAVIVSVSEPVRGQRLDIAAPVIGATVLSPPSAGIALGPVGGQATATVTLLPTAATSATPVTVTSSDPAIATVLGPVSIGAGQRAVQLRITTGIAGVATLTLTAGTTSRQLRVIVGTPPPGTIPPVFAPPVGVTVLTPPSAGGPVLTAPNGEERVTVPLLPAPATDRTTVTITSSDRAVADVLGAVEILAGNRSATFTIIAGDQGLATLTLTAGSTSRQLTVIVGPPPPGTIPPVLAPPVGVEVAP